VKGSVGERRGVSSDILRETVRESARRGSTVFHPQDVDIGYDMQRV